MRRLLPTALKRAYLWQIDGAVRYAPALRLFRRHGTPQSRILEIGSGATGITVFLPRPVVGYDVDFTGPDLGYLQRVEAPHDWRALPFADNEFDFVLAMDVLEHVPRRARAAMLGEMLRVARGWLIVGVPCGPVAAEYDRRLYDWLRRRFGLDHPWLREHFEMGLPQAEEIEAAIRQRLGHAGAQLTVEDNFNVDAWLWAWQFHMSRNRFWRSIKSKLLWALANRLAQSPRQPAYRKVFVVRKTEASPLEAAA